MNEKKIYTPPLVYEVALDHEQAILSQCSLFAMAASAGGANGCRAPNGCGNYPNANPNGCKRSVIPLTYMGAVCHDQGVRPS
jgi:hypothetical protein